MAKTKTIIFIGGTALIGIGLYYLLRKPAPPPEEEVSMDITYLKVNTK